jgi:type IV secretory pathway VirB10-like protein
MSVLYVRVLTRYLIGTACWPCRQRKVKCDNKQPCENCVKREHPQLCSYKPNRSSANRNSTASASAVPPASSVGAAARKRARSPADDADDSRKSSERGDSWPRTIGMCNAI